MNLRGSTDLDVRDYYNLLHSHEYTEDTGIGFRELNIEENNSISGLVVKRTPIFINVFDAETQSIVEREEFIITEIDFVLDITNRLIEIYGSIKNVKKLMTTFLQTVGETIKLEQLNLKPSKMLEAFKEEVDSCEITKLHIKDFSSEKGVIGSYDIKSVNPDIAWRLVDEYKNDVVKATISVDEGSVEALIQIFQNGKFKVTTKPRNNADLILYTIKNLISKNLQ